MSRRQPSLLIEDIIESGRKILSYTAGLTIEQFLGDEKTVDAVIRNFEVIGEAAGNLPIEFRSQYPDIDWHRIKGFRNRIVHEYFGIDYEIVWKIKETYLHEMLQKLSEIKG